VDWKEVGAWQPADFVAGMRRYIESDDPAWPNEDRHYRDATIFLERQRPDPASLRPLLGPDATAIVDTHLLKRDKVAQVVLHSFMGRIAKGDDQAAALWDNVVYATIHFAFEAVYEASHPGVAESLVEFFSDDRVLASDESEAAFRRYLEPLVEKWRGRVTRKASSMFFGNLLRHVGADAANRLFREWDDMDENERVDLLRRAAYLDEGLDRGARTRAIDALLDDSMEVREAAWSLLSGLSAPLGDLDAGSRDEEIEKVLPQLRSWAAETKS